MCPALLFLHRLHGLPHQHGDLGNVGGGVKHLKHMDRWGKREGVHDNGPHQRLWALAAAPPKDMLMLALHRI